MKVIEWLVQLPFYLPLKVRIFWVIRFRPSRGLFSWLINHSTVSLTILFMISAFWCLYVYFEQFCNCVPVRCNKKTREWLRWPTQSWEFVFVSTCAHSFIFLDPNNLWQFTAKGHQVISPWGQKIEITDYDFTQDQLGLCRDFTLWCSTS